MNESPSHFASAAAATQTGGHGLGYRQFMWGLSNGIFVLALAGAFWFGLAAWAAASSLAIAPIALATVVLAYGARRVRRQASGFQIKEIKGGSDAERARTRRIQVGFRWLSLMEGGLSGLAVFLCLHTHREDLIWPGLALGVSLHFAPLAHLVSVRPYYIAAACGSLVAIAGLSVPEASLSPALRTAGVGIGMGAVIWITAAYASLRADTLVLAWNNARGPRR
jgi:hypothetical protein